MTEQIVMVVAGVILILVSFIGQGISHGMPPHRAKPYPMTRPLRVTILGIGLLSLALGVVNLLRR